MRIWYLISTTVSLFGFGSSTSLLLFRIFLDLHWFSASTPTVFAFSLSLSFALSYSFSLESSSEVKFALLLQCTPSRQLLQSCLPMNLISLPLSYFPWNRVTAFLSFFFHCFCFDLQTKCTRYWPECVGKTMSYRGIKVTLTEELFKLGRAERTMVFTEV